MTVIAWDGKTLAADKRCGQELPRTVTKIRRAPNGALIGCTGNAGKDQELMAWYEAGADPAMFPAAHRDETKSSHMIAIERSPAGPVVRMFIDSPFGVIFENEFHAIGGGRDFAMAAMHMGEDARAAVEVAIALCAGCGNGVDTLTLDAGSPTSSSATVAAGAS